MKTPMQELIEQLNNVKPQDFCSIETIKGWAKELLWKEKEVVNDAYITGFSDRDIYHQAEDCYYSETFKTKER
jgi:hypothetical protein